MDSRDSTLAQLDALFVELAPMSFYVRKLESRLHHECFPADDELVEQRQRSDDPPIDRCALSGVRDVQYRSNTPTRSR